MPRSSEQSAQHYPLTLILGTEANVRILRELSRNGGQLSRPDLRHRTGLSRASVWAALAALERTGIVAVAGAGRTRLYSLAKHPLRDALDALFEAEERRFSAILESIRQAAIKCEPRVQACWVFGSVARGEDHPDSDVDVLVVAAEKVLPKITDQMRDALQAAGDELNFSPSVVGLSPEDVARLSREQDPWWAGVVQDALVVSGAYPDELIRALHAGKEGAGA